MNLQPVAVLPKFSYICVTCRQRYTSLERAPIADLDGTPFQSYYCAPHGNQLALATGGQRAIA